MFVDHRRIQKILVLRYRSIGDIVLSYPTVEALRLTFPKARLDFVVDDIFADICYNNPHINYLILNKKKQKESGLKSFVDELKFIWKIRKQKYDLVIDLHCGPRSAMLAFLSGASYRVGSMLRTRNRIFYNIQPPPAKHPHSVEAMLSIIKPLNPVMPKSKSLFLKYSDEDRDYIASFLLRYEITDKEKLVVIHPGARVDFKRLPPKKMGEIVSWLTAQFGVKVVLAGADSDLPAISDIASASGQTCLIASNLTLGQLSALIDSAKLFICNDSGPMHMASALGTPIIAFFGPSDPKIWAPWKAKGRIVRAPKMDCMPCDQKNCGKVPNHCMAKIRTEDIKTAFSVMLRKKAEPVVTPR